MKREGGREQEREGEGQWSERERGEERKRGRDVPYGESEREKKREAEGLVVGCSYGKHKRPMPHCSNQSSPAINPAAESHGQAPLSGLSESSHLFRGAPD